MIKFTLGPQADRRGRPHNASESKGIGDVHGTVGTPNGSDPHKDLVSCNCDYRNIEPE